MTKTLRMSPGRKRDAARGDAHKVEPCRFVAEPGVGFATLEDGRSGDEVGGDDVLRVGRFAVEVDPPGALPGPSLGDVVVETVGVEVVAVPGGTGVEVLVADAAGIGFAGEAPGGV